MNKRKILLLLTTACFCLSSCSFPFVGDTAPASNTEPQSTVEEQTVPTIIVEHTAESEKSATLSENVPEDSFHGYVLSEEEKNDTHVICKETVSENEVTLLFAGDIALDDNWSNMNALRGRANGIYDSLSAELMTELQSADIFMINNEFPYSDRGTPTAGKQFTFRAKPERVEILNQMGVDIVSLANNHAYDHGPDALMDTFSTLQGANIPYVGAGANLSEAMMPTYFIAGGMKIGFVSATQIERNDPPDTKEATEDSPGVLRTLNPDKFLTVIEEAENNSDFVVVYVHWGSENVYDAEQAQRDLATQYADAGADLIIGGHSHCLQGFEYTNDIPVIYSLGNFWFNSKNLDTGIVKITLRDSAISSYQFLPCLQHDCKTDLLLPGTDGSYERILGVMAGLSYDVSLDENGFISRGAGNGVAAVEPRALKKPNYAASANAIDPALIPPAAEAVQ